MELMLNKYALGPKKAPVVDVVQYKIQEKTSIDILTQQALLFLGNAFSRNFVFYLIT